MYTCPHIKWRVHNSGSSSVPSNTLTFKPTKTNKLKFQTKTRCLANSCYTQGFNILVMWQLNRTSPIFKIWQFTLEDAGWVKHVRFSAGCAEDTLLGLYSGQLLWQQGTLIAVTHWNFKEVWRQISLLYPERGSTRVRSSARKQHALVCDRLNYTLYKIVNNICILYTRLVFPTVKGKSLEWKRGGPNRVQSVNRWDWDHLHAGGFDGHYCP